MGWKDLPTWAKAGISLVLIQLGLTIIFWIIGLIGLAAVLNGIGYSIIPVEQSVFYLIAGILVSAVIYFVIGSAIGWIYGKIKQH